VLPNATRAQKLTFDARTDVQAIVTAGRNELKAFQTAVADKTAGYEHLNQARARAGEALGVDPAYDGAQRLSADVEADNQKLNQAIQTGESLVAGKHFDEAYNALTRYRSLAGEVPRVAAVVDAAFQYRRGLADGLVQEKKWQPAIEEYRRALNYKEDAATTEAMKKAQAELQLDQDKDTAAKAVAESEDLAAKKQYVEAYERLAALTPSQRSFANEEVDKLKAPYVDDAVKRAETLSRVHLPIRGRADEDGIRQGYRYLRQAAQLDAENEALKVKLDVFSDRVSDFYLKEAQQMFAKPRGSGVGLGWMFLLEAQRFKPDLNAIKDEMTKQEPLYETRSKLSLGLRLRDQTSRRDSVGFADQLSDSVSAGLEAAGVPALKMMAHQERPAGGDAASALEPNFLVLCDILQHKVTKTVDTQHVASHYRAGQHEVRNPTWAEAKRALDALQEQFNTSNAQAAALAVAKKKQSQQFAKEAQVLAQQITEARQKLDAIPETLLQDIIQPYNYTRRTFDVTATVEFVFGVADSGGATQGQTTVKVEVPKKFKVVENVKPEDVDGVQEEGSTPDETQVLSDAETQAQAALIKKIVEKIRELPPRILEDARRKAAAKDSASAAEAYILYLNTTVNKDTPERAEAAGFLAREYNVGATAP